MTNHDQVTLQIGGMTCDGCVARTRRALEAVEGTVELRLSTGGRGTPEVIAETAASGQDLNYAVEAKSYRTPIPAGLSHWCARLRTNWRVSLDPVRRCSLRGSYG